MRKRRRRRRRRKRRRRRRGSLLCSVKRPHRKTEPPLVQQEAPFMKDVNV
jgi:hypothetical protein